MGNTKEIAMVMASAQSLAIKLQDEQDMLQENFASGNIDSGSFLKDSMINIHRNYCASKGLPFNGEKES